jgi:hypothetical protein
MYPAAMMYAPSGHIEQLPSGSWRAKVYAGKDPLTGREIRFRKTRRTEVEAQIELGRLLELSRAEIALMVQVERVFGYKGTWDGDRR